MDKVHVYKKFLIFVIILYVGQKFCAINKHIFEKGPVFFMHNACDSIKESDFCQWPPTHTLGTLELPHPF